MTATRQILLRLGAPDAVSWPVFWVSYLINVIIALVSGFDAQAVWWQRIIAATAGQVVMFAFLFAIRYALLARLVGVARAVATVVAFAVAGAFRGAAVSLAFIVLGPSSIEVLIPRIPGGVAFGLVVLIPVALAVVTVRSYRRTREDLLTRSAALEAARRQVVDEIEQRDAYAIDQVREAFQEAVEADDPSALAAERLRAFATNVVRPLSHELASAVPTWRPDEGVGARVTVRDVLDRAAWGRPFLPWTTAVTAGALSVSWFVFEEGLPAALVYLVGGMLAVAAGLWFANTLLERLLPGRKLAMRVLLIVIGAAFAGVVFGVVATILASSTPWVTALWAAGLIFMPVLAFVLALARAMAAGLTTSLNELRRVEGDLAWQVARLHQLQWTHQRATARALHGPVQAMVSAAVVNLNAGAAREETLGQLREQLAQALDPASALAASVHWISALERIEATWQGLCDVRIDVDEQAGAALDADAVGADIAMEIIAEAVSNAIRHGKAKTVHIEMHASDDRLRLAVRNDGSTTVASSHGLGTAMIEDCSMEWSRGPVEGDFALDVVLPTQG